MIETRLRPPVRRFLLLGLVGAIGGLMSGAFGVGGGVVMVPLLILLCGLDQRRAAATSLVAIVPTAIVAATSYLIRGELNVLAALIVASGGIAGSLLGTRLLKRLPLGWLRWLFIALMVLVAIRMVIEPPTRGGDLVMSPLTVAGLVGLGIAMGIAAGLFGIGGGVIAVPVFVALFGMGDLLAKGTSLLAIIPPAVSGSVANARNRLVHWPDGLVAGLCAVAASFAGVELAFWIDPKAGSIAFAVLLLVASGQLAVRAIRQRRKELEDTA